MIVRSIILMLCFLSLTADASAQRKKVNIIEWKVAGILPFQSNGEAALGVAGAIAGVHNNVLIVAGGANFPDGAPWLGGKKKYHGEVYVFKKQGDSLVHYKTVHLAFSIGYSASVSTMDGILSAGGENETGITNKVFIVGWDSSLNDVVITDLPQLPFAVTNAAITVQDDKIYIAGGEGTNDVSNEFLVLDLNNAAAGWKSLPSLSKPVSHAVMVAQKSGAEDCIYLIGGRKRNAGGKSTLYNSVLQYNIKKELWIEKSPIPYALSAGTGAALSTTHIGLFGGDAGETFHKAEALIAAIGKEGDEEKKKQLNEEKIKVQSNHPGFCRLVWMYDTAKDKWEKGGCMPFSAPVTTTAVLCDGEVWIPSGEIKAGVRSPQILSGKIASKNERKF